MNERRSSMKQELLAEMERVLAFWKENAITPEGEFLTLGCDNRPLEDGRKSAVLMSRMVWAYSAAFNLTGKQDYLRTAGQAFEYLLTHFADKTYGGVYECLDRDGKPSDRRKVIYTQSYAVYAASEYARASGKTEAREFSRAVFNKIEVYAFDSLLGGYRAELTEKWRAPAEPQDFLMDTHLHLMEAYTAFSRVWKEIRLKRRLEAVVRILLDRFLRENGTLYQSLGPDWSETEDLSDRFGDESECTWMMEEAAAQVGKPSLLAEVREAQMRMMRNLCSRGYDGEHGGVYDRLNSDGSMSAVKLWWEESEAVTALLYVYRLTGEPEYFGKAAQTWDFIRAHFIDPESEWRWETEADGTPVPVTDPSDPLKCPYHTTRITYLSVPVLETVS